MTFPCRFDEVPNEPGRKSGHADWMISIELILDAAGQRIYAVIIGGKPDFLIERIGARPIHGDSVDSVLVVFDDR